MVTASEHVEQFCRKHGLGRYKAKRILEDREFRNDMNDGIQAAYRFHALGQHESALHACIKLIDRLEARLASVSRRYDGIEP